MLCPEAGAEVLSRRAGAYAKSPLHSLRRWRSMSLWGLTTRSRTLRKWRCRDSQLKGVDWEGTEGNRTPCRTGRCGSHGPGRSGAHAVRWVTPGSALADPIRAWRPHIADASPVLGELVICQSACKYSLGETVWLLQVIDERGDASVVVS